MTSASETRAAWRGRALVVVAALHCLFVVVLGSAASNDRRFQPYVGSESPWSGLHPGLGSDLPPKLWLLSLVWSLFFGLCLALLGVLVHVLERQQLSVPRAFSVALMIIAGAGALLMPTSGFWLVLLVAAALVKRP